MKEFIQKMYKSKIVKNSFWLTILQCVNTVVPLITVPYITRILGSSGYGQFSTALNLIIYFQVIVEFGFGLNGARKAAVIKNDQDLQQLYNNIISSRIILTIFTFILLNIIAWCFSISMTIYISMLFLFIMIIGTSFQLTWLFQGKQDMKFITIINTISRFISVVLIFVLVKNSNDIYLYCILYSLTILVSSIISVIVVRKKYNLKFNFSKFKDIKSEISEGKYLFASAAMTKIFSGFGVTVLSVLSTDSFVGIYSAIYKIPYVLTLFFSPVSQAIYPFISQKFSKSFDEGLNGIKKICVPILLFFVSLSIIIVLVRNIIVNILFGEEYLPYAIIIIPLIVQFIFGMINNFLGVQILVASNNQKLYTKSFFIGCIGIVISNVVLTKLFDIYGTSIACVIGELILTIALLLQIKKIRSNSNERKIKEK